MQCSCTNTPATYYLLDCTQRRCQLQMVSIKSASGNLAGGVATLCEDGHLFSNPLVWSLRKPVSTLSETYDSHLGRNAFKRKKPCCRILTPNCSKYFHSDRTRTRTLSYVAEGLGNLTPNSSLSY